MQLKKIEQMPPEQAVSPWRLSVAPMLDVTDRHCRYFHRLMTRHTLLYTEMINAGAAVHGGTARHLQFDAVEHPVALQLGGNDPDLLARAARLGADYGYDEINLNCGCPSDRVQRGAFGVSLMREPALVARCWQAMAEATAGRIPITIKHRIGIDQDERLDLVMTFVQALYAAGCRVFIVHARNAWLKGLSPKDNRTIPPLRYAVLPALKAAFPAATFVLNGGLVSTDDIAQALQLADGAMLGRAAWHEPYRLAQWDQQFFGSTSASISRATVEEAMVRYMAEMQSQGVHWMAVARHMLGLYHGERGARAWRQVWSDHKQRDFSVQQVALTATHARCRHD